ncbi:MAG: thioredoxin-related protein [Bacteroidota bacterium]|nr:thioredoxin-related protein [Bacteroidota bacterium]
MIKSLKNVLPVILIALAFSSYADGPKINPVSETAKSGNPEKKINWLSWEEMVKLNEKNPKKIFIDFYTSWCGWCKVMDRNTFEDTLIAQMMSKDFYCVKFDAERKDTIHFQNRNWVFIPGGRTGYHELAAYFMQNELSYPTMCVLTPKYELITPLKGYIAVPQFEPVISFIGQDFWMSEKKKNFEEYKVTYKSPRTTPWLPPQ